MKILLSVHQFYPEFRAGTEVLTLSVARELLRRGHEVRVYTGYPAGGDLQEHERFDRYVFEDIHVYRFKHAYVPMAGQYSRVEVDYDNILAADFFDEILSEFAADRVHFFHLNRLGTRLIERAGLAGVPAYMTLTDFWAVCPTGQLLLPGGDFCKGPSRYAGNCVKHFAQNTQVGLPALAAKLLPVQLIDILTKQTLAGRLPTYPHSGEVKAIAVRLGLNIARLNQLAAIVVPNGMMRDTLIANGADPDLIVELAYGVEVSECAAEEFKRVAPQPFVFGFIGTLAHHKGCHVLIEAFQRLPKNIAILKVYGSLDEFPEYSQNLQHLAAENAAIEFCGTFANADIGQIFAGIDVLVVPSVWHENTPLVVYSAQAARCPVLASDLEGVSGVIVDGDNGLLFEPGNVLALTDKLLRLINEADLLARLSANAKVPKSITVYVDELLSVWALD